jgi:hypothetical protein
VTVEPFEACDLRNIGVSRFCTITSKKPLPMTEKFATQIYNAYANKTAFGRYNYIPMVNSERYYYDNLFGFEPITYNAFDNDIAMVQIIFQKSTAVLMGSQLAMTWIDTLATVGGLLGLVLGKAITKLVISNCFSTVGNISFFYTIAIKIVLQQQNIIYWVV